MAYGGMRAVEITVLSVTEAPSLRALASYSKNAIEREADVSYLAQAISHERVVAFSLGHPGFWRRRAPARAVCAGVVAAILYVPWS